MNSEIGRTTFSFFPKIPSPVAIVGLVPRHVEIRVRAFRRLKTMKSTPFGGSMFTDNYRRPLIELLLSLGNVRFYRFQSAGQTYRSVYIRYSWNVQMSKYYDNGVSTEWIVSGERVFGNRAVVGFRYSGEVFGGWGGGLDLRTAALRHRRSKSLVAKP